MASYACITPWVTFTPTLSWVTNTTTTATYARQGNLLLMRITLVLAGAPDAAILAMTGGMPLGVVTDRVAMAAADDGSGNATRIPCGYGRIWDNSGGAAAYRGPIQVVQSENLQFVANMVTTAPSTMTDVSSTVPVTFAVNDRVYLYIEVPIVGW